MNPVQQLENAKTKGKIFQFNRHDEPSPLYLFNPKLR